MDIIIIGAGEVGTHIARFLSQERHNVVVVDQDIHQLNRVDDVLDVQTLHGCGTDLDILLKAGAAKADLVLAVSSSDEVNFAAALLARRLGAKRTLVRARKPFYLDEHLSDYSRAFEVDRIVCPEVMTAAEIARLVEHPGTMGVAFFARGRIQMRRLEVEANTPGVGRPLAEVPFPQGALLASISRNGDIIVPHGSDMVQPKDIVTVIGLTRDITRIQALFRTTKEVGRHVLIAGGGLIGTVLARILEQGHYRVRVVDRDLERCEALSSKLDRTQILHGDVTDLRFLQESRLGEADVFVAATNNDETNVMACLLMSRLGTPTRIAIVHRPDFAPLLQEVGITHALSPRFVMADAVVNTLMRDEMTSIQLLEEGRAEVIELRVPSRSQMAGVMLKDANLPKGGILAAIVRHGEVFVPRGNDKIMALDIVVAYALTGVAPKLQELLKKTV